MNYLILNFTKFNLVNNIIKLLFKNHIQLCLQKELYLIIMET
jgi:hypothetical protein